MSEAGQFLRRARAIFEQHAIHIEPQIVEHLAFLFLLHNQWNVLRDLRPDVLARTLQTGYHELHNAYPRLQTPSRFPTEQLTLEGIRELLFILEQALRVPLYENNLGNFFQREIRWEMLKSSTGSQYPTPYHIAAFMAKLGVTDPDARVLDPTMGSAGLLAAALSEAPNVSLVGADFDPIWAAIGSANLILHGKGDATVFLGSSLAKFQDWNDLFDTVLMNPPFGGSRGVHEVAETVGEEFGRNNATVMGAFALQALCPNGRAVFLTPSGTLFAERGAEANLKTAILNEALEAVITLPKRAFYPYSNIEAHLIVVRKRVEGEAPPLNPVWFCQIDADGYPEGSERDLTAPANTQSDELPRVQSLILNIRQPEAWQTHFTLDGIGTIQTTLLSPATSLAGVGMRVVGEQLIPKWEIISLTNRSLVKIRNQQAQLQAWLSIHYPEGEITALTREQVNAHAWTQMLPRIDCAEEVAGQWVNETVYSTLQVQTSAQPALTLEQGRTTYRFTPTGEHTEIACLLAENGQPQTPWLRVAAPQKIREAEFGGRFAAISLQDASETQIGWLLEWAQVRADAAENPTKGILLIVFQDQVGLFEQAGTVFGFAHNGYFCISLEEGTFHLEQGQPIRQREGVALGGVAIGPAAGAGQGQRMFAALLGRTAFAPSGDLRPSRFLPEPEAAPMQLPASVIANIRKNQTRFNDKVSNLLGLLGDASKQAAHNNLAYPVPDWIVEMLDDQQKALWQMIASHQVDGRSAHFNTKDLLAWKAEMNASTTYSDADALMQLELFTRIGLTMKVHSKGENLYRCLNYQDVLKPQVENPEGHHEAT